MTLMDEHVLYVVDGWSMTAKGLVQLGRYLDGVESIADITDDMRAVIEKEFPQHLYKVAPKRPIG